MREPPFRAPIHVTGRERQILTLIARGRSDKQIACELGIASRTVRTHMERLFQRNQLHSRAEAVAAWLTLIDGSPVRDTQFPARTVSDGDVE